MDIKEVVHPFLVRIKGKEAEMADAVKAVFGAVKLYPFRMWKANLQLSQDR